MRHVIQMILDGIGSQVLSQERRVDARLYGGWFYRDLLSRHAQRLLEQLPQGQLVMTLGVSGSGRGKWMEVSVEMARSLACDPKTELTHTFRPRSTPPNLYCQPRPFVGCVTPDTCKLQLICKLIGTGCCPIARCNASLSAVLRLAEQKLVDSMVVADLIYFAHNTQEHLAVVSGDDDLWPGIRAALLGGARVTHLVPRRHRSHSHLYKELTMPSYSRLSI